MSDEYLWDRSGMPARDEVELEGLLSPYRFHTDSSAELLAPQPLRSPQAPWLKAAGALVAAAACVGVGWWLGSPEPQPAVTPVATAEPVQPGSDAQPATSVAGSLPLPPQGVSPAQPAPVPTVPTWQTPGDDPTAEPSGTGVPARPPLEAKGGGLTPSQVRDVIANNRMNVKRRCWDRAVRNRRQDAPSTARVNINLTVHPSGRVSAVSSNGDPKGYPGLSSCVESQVRGWRFPSVEASTSVRVPFVFSAG